MSTTPVLDPTGSRPAAPGRRTPLGSWVGLAGIAGFLAAAVVTDFVTPGYDARREAISALAAADSPHARVMIAGFVLGAVGLLSAAAVLWRAVSQRAAHIAAVLVGISGVLIGVAGFAREDCSDQLASCKDYGEALEASGSYWLHQYASLLAFLLLIVSFFVLARGLRKNGRAGVAVASRVVGVLCLAGTVLLVTTPSFVVDNYGIVQRVFVAVLFGWPVAAGLLASRAGAVTSLARTPAAA